MHSTIKKFGLIALTIALLLVVAGREAHPQSAWSTPAAAAGAPTGSCTVPQLYSDTTTGNVWTCPNGTWKLAASGVVVLRATTGGLGGSPLTVGACSTTTVTVTGALPSMAASASPVADPGAGFYWLARVNTINQATVYVCAAIAGTPTTLAYNVAVNP